MIIAENLPARYSHQLYFFGEDSNSIRQYFQDLIKVAINNNINTNGHLEEYVYNYAELAQKIAVLTKNSKHYNNILSMLQTDEALKVIVALLFKGFGWRNEIYETFNISSKLYVETTLGTLQKISLLNKEKGIKLNHLFYEALTKIKNVNLGGSLSQADLYFINGDFIKFCSLVKDLFEFKARTSESFKFSLKSIIEDSQHFNDELDRIIDEESNQTSRKHFANGVYYETETIKSRQMKKDLKKAIAELKVEQLEAKEQQNLLSSSEAGQLAIYRESNNALALIPKNELSSDIQKFKKTRKPTSLYNDQECNAEQIFDELKKQDQEIEKAETIIGKPEMAFEKSIFDNGIYLSVAAIEEWEQDSKPKTAEQEVDDLFASMGVNL